MTHLAVRAPGDRRQVRTMCPMNCHPTFCGMVVDVEDDRVLGVRGDEDNPDSRGFLCIRGQASGEIVDNPARILRPRVRDIRRDDAWRDATWHEALDRVVSAIRRVGPEAVAVWPGHGALANSIGFRMAPRFANLAGFQWWNPSMVCWGIGGFGISLTGPVEVSTKEDMGAHSDLILPWGANIASQPNTGRHLAAAKKRGAWIAAIDVRRREAFEQAHETHLIRPGTDAALALALIQVIVDERLHDEAFVSAHTTGFAELAAHVRPYTPEWAEAETGIPAVAVRALARRYAATRRSMILIGGSSMNKSANGWQAGRAIACLPALSGALGRPGGGLGPRHAALSHGGGLANLEARDRRPPPPSGRPYIISEMSTILDELDAGRVKVLLLFGTNMVSSFADAGRVARALRSESWMGRVTCDGGPAWRGDMR
jgi:anaerobic selenocysteine-containing dehydrogenase